MFFERACVRPSFETDGGYSGSKKLDGFRSSGLHAGRRVDFGGRADSGADWSGRSFAGVWRCGSGILCRILRAGSLPPPPVCNKAGDIWIIRTMIGTGAKIPIPDHPAHGPGGACHGVPKIGEPEIGR